MSKYDPLWQFIKDKTDDEFKMTYDEIATVLGFSIDHSFLKYKKELTTYGYQVKKISMKEETVIFEKVKEQ